MIATFSPVRAQDNLEYFGDGEYMMFDNNFNKTEGSFNGNGPSRLLIVSVDEDAETATLEWELVLEDHTPIYGDNDRLPTGNLLASSWPATINANASFQYDVRIFETVRATKQPAWEAFVLGQGCQHPDDGSGGCVRSTGAIPTGWSMYSVERFYDAPLVWNISCDAARSAATTVHFTAHNVFKQNGPRPGTFRFFAAGDNGEHDAALLEGWFNFSAYWRETHVSVDISDFASEKGRWNGMLSVTNEWGDRTAKAVSCGGGDSDR